MRNRAKTWQRIIYLAVCAAGLAHLSQAQNPPAPAPQVIGQAADNLAAQALDLLNNGNLTDAATAYSSLLDKYPNSGAVPEALFRLGYIEYVQGDYPGAITTLQRIVSPPASPEIKAASDALSPQVLAAQASKLSLDDPNRKAAYQTAISQFDAFIQKYPKSPAIETANYGRAFAAFQIGDLEGAMAGLETNLRQFPTSETIADTEDLLAVVLTAQAGDILRNHGDPGTAMRKFRDALRYLVDIIEHRREVALANDAQFQIAEILFERGNAEEAARRARDVSHAIEAYRAVLPKDTLIRMQEQRVAALLERRRQAALTRDSAEIQAVQRVEDRENAKLQALRDAPDQTMNAQMRIVASYYLLQRYDEARVLLRFLQPFAEDEGQKVQIAYYTVLTYASQGLIDKAVPAYNDFVIRHRGDPAGENLPLAMGAAFLDPKVNQPQKALSYFREEGLLYPRSPLVNVAMAQQAAVLIGMQRFASALAVYQHFLETNPKPAPAQAAQAEMGIANIYQASNRNPDAIRQFEKVAATYPRLPEAEQAAFYAAGLETTTDPKKAIADLQAFVKQFPNGRFTPRAMMMIAQTQAATGDTTAAVQTFKDVAATFPTSDFGPQSYFDRAAILGKQKKTGEIVALMKDFIKAYPDGKGIFYAYDTIGQAQAATGDLPAAIATYKEMVTLHPEDPMAARALYRTADLLRKQAEGREYLALNDADREAWNKDIANSIAAAESVLRQYPDSDQLGNALRTLLADQQMRMDAGQTTQDDVDKYFNGLADKFARNPSTRKRILFTLATFTYGKDRDKGLERMAAAYDDSLVYAPADLDLYGRALLDHGSTGDSYKIYEKLSNDYPVPAGVEPAETAPATQDAQAIALDGMGNALEKEGKTEDAARLFLQLKTYYPWSPKVVDANYGIAKAMIPENKLDDASQLLIPIVSNRNVAASLRAHAFLLSADIQAAKGNLPAAIDSYLKMAAFYGGVQDAAPEGLWKGGQLLERQAMTLDEQSTPRRSDQIAKAVNAYRNIVNKYPDSQYAKQAQDRLGMLAAKS